VLFRSLEKTLSYYMGKNTPERQQFIVEHLRVEKDWIPPGAALPEPDIEPGSADAGLDERSDDSSDDSAVKSAPAGPRAGARAKAPGLSRKAS